jgi:hypothetical protein
MAVFPYVNPIFQPAIRVITAISTIQIAEVLFAQITTSQPHLYNDGLVVRLNIPLGFGFQLYNQATSTIAVNSPTTFIVGFPNEVNAQTDPFSIPANALQQAQTIPVAEDVLVLDSAVVNTLFTYFIG